MKIGDLSPLNLRLIPFSEYLTLPHENLHVLPISLTDDQAVFIEPLAAACEMTQQIDIKPSDHIVVLGDGKLGLLCAQVLRLMGCAVTLLGHHHEKGAWLQKRGIQVITSPKDTLQQIDIVVEATGTPEGLMTAMELVRPRGTIILKSTYHGKMDLNLSKLVIDEISLLGSRCGPFAPAIRLLQEDLVEIAPMIHARYSLSNGLAAFQHASKKGTLKVLVSVN